MKQAVLNLMLKTGGFAPFRWAHRSQALILCYHRFSSQPENRKTSAPLFAENLHYLKAHYTIVSLAELATRLQRGKSVRGLAAITIDDGYADAYEVAFPLLRQYQAPATLFVTTDFLSRKAWLWTDKLRYIALHTAANELRCTLKGQTRGLPLNGPYSRLAAADQANGQLKAWPNEVKDREIERLAAQHGVTLPPLPPDEYRAITWAQAREMDAQGVAIESHTVTHPILTQIDGQQLRFEMREARRQLAAELGRDVQLFCYPDGAYNVRVREAAAEAGYACAVTTRQGLNAANSDLLTLRRVHGESDHAHFVQATSGFEAFKLKWLRRTEQEVTPA
jgi:peptidoglycan/xylan/chitin deacetylase (PgdA/CDA1 family)